MADKFEATRKNKAKQRLREAELLHAKATHAIEEKDLAGTKFQQAQDLFQQAEEKYKQASKLIPLAAIQLALINCLTQWAEVLVKKGEDFLQIAQKKQDKFSRSKRTAGNQYLYDAAEKYESCLDLIEKMKDLSITSDSGDDLQLDSENLLMINRMEISILIELGKAQSIRGLGLMTEAEGLREESNFEQSTKNLGEAFFLFKKAAENFSDCVAKNSENYSAVRHWGSCLCKQAFTLTMLGLTNPDPTKLMKEGGEKLLHSYRLFPTSPKTKKALCRFFFDQGSLIIKQAQNQSSALDQHSLAEADQLLSLALRFSHPNPTTQLLNAYGELLLSAAHKLPKGEYCDNLLLLAEEYFTQASWVGSKNFSVAITVLRRFGYVIKQGKVRANWKRRFLVLTSKSITYYQKPDGKTLGLIKIPADLKGVSIDQTEERDFCFALITPNRRYLVSVDDEQTMWDWISAIEAALAGQPIPPVVL